MARAELIARLERDAQARVDASAGRASSEVLAIERQATLASSREVSDKLAELRRTRRARLQHALAEARAQARRLELEARQRVVERVFARVEQLLDAAPAAFDAALPARAARAMPYVGQGALRGALLTSADGVCSVDLGAAALLMRERPRLAIVLAKELAP